jgi:putative N-acetylmannosamine-6-phosphate epimerase
MVDKEIQEDEQMIARMLTIGTTMFVVGAAVAAFQHATERYGPKTEVTTHAVVEVKE